MGCASSHDRCLQPPIPLSSSSSIPQPPPPPPPPPPSFRFPTVVNHPPLHLGDSHHLVSLTSSTYGLLDNPKPAQKEPHSPTAVIDAWALMAGLEKPHHHLFRRSLTYHHPPCADVKPLWRHLADDQKPGRSPPRVPVVLYTTSLRSIRRTHEDCTAVRNILRGLRVAVDDRDVSMDAAFRRQLREILPPGRAPQLPQLVVGGKLVGGADEVRRLHEDGELGRLLQGAAREEPGWVCKGCGGVRFVPCPECRGSRKVFEEEEGRMRRCEECNENGLMMVTLLAIWHRMMMLTFVAG